ncbi:excinuclease ATPase subunit [Vibrio gangliei]|uniref:excinuclease ATPase subunit n=1 Tax=Vibrio gangliei TaxID=2077090 RepID=UPI000D013540|nr:excinuclease ATPase subunit [Vibrio gangliei]
MKNHKSKILALCITSALLYGCGSDSDDSSSNTMEVQAYDGPVRGMIANYSCDDDSTGTSKATDDDGIAVLSGTFADAPETCSITYTGNSDAVDMENGRDMSGVKYSAPKGLFTKGEPATVSPLTSLIDKQLNGATYDESTAQEVLASLGLDEIANNGISIKELLSDTEASVSKLKESNKTLFSKLAATKMILSDAVNALPDADPSKIAAVTKKLSETLVKNIPEFPINDSGKEIVVNLKEKLKESGFADKVESGEISDEDIEQALEDNIADATKPEPSNPDTPATGGTGGTGGTGSTGTGA